MKKNIKYVLTLVFGIGVMFLAQSCGDSLGIEDNYSKKLISGKDIKDISYKEYVKITRDTLIFYSDTTIHVDTVHYPVYDSVKNSKSYPTKGFVFDMYSLVYSKNFQPDYYPIMSMSSNITVEYINTKPILNISMDIQYAIQKSNPYFKEFNELPKSIKIELRGVTLFTNYLYYLDGEPGSGNFGSIVLINNSDNRLTYEGRNSNLSFYVKDYITSPDDNNKVLYVSGVLVYNSKTSGVELFNLVNMLLY